MSQVTLQDCIDELEKIKKIAISEECGVDPKRITKVQYMIQSVSEAVLNLNSERWGCSTHD